MNQPKRSTQDGDIQFANPPSDSISSLCLNGYPNTPPNAVIATSWDSSVSCYELRYAGNQIQVVPQARINHIGPVLCSDFSPDNVTVFTGGCDGAVKLWNVTQGASGARDIGKHDAAVKSVKFVPEKNLVLTGSWDNTLRAWDSRQPNAVATIRLGERVYAMDAKSQIAVVGTSDRQIRIYDLNTGTARTIYRSPLAYQTRCVSIFADSLGFAVGCIEGRIALEYYDELDAKGRGQAQVKTNPKSFAFKCHRDTAANPPSVYAVNAIDFHPNNTFLSAGSDGVITFWDKESKHRLAALDKFRSAIPGVTSPINDAKYSKAGNMIVYSVSYDWSRGSENNDKRIGTNLYIHPLDPVEMTPKSKK